MVTSFRSIPPRALAFVTAQAVSSLGSVMTGFALNVWVYQQTRSYTTFALLAVIAAVPGLVFAPFAGVIVDRYPRKRVVIACDVVCAIAVAGLFLASVGGTLSTTLIAMIIVVLALARTVAWPASGASVTALTTAAQRGRVNGLVETFAGAVGMLGPLLGGALFSLVSVTGIAIIDVVSYLICIGVVARIPFPAFDSGPPGRDRAGSRARELLRNCLFGFKWIAARRDLTTLLLFFVALNLSGAICVVAYAPYILSFTTAQVLGLCLAVGSGGMIAGGLAFAASGGMKRQESGVLWGAILVGTTEIGLGMTRSEWVLPIIAFLYGLSIPLLNASSQTIWQSRVPAEIQGRVFSIRKMIAWGLNPLSVLLSIPFLAAVFTPLLAMGSGAWSLQAVWGSGQTAALGLMISTCGLSCVAVALLLLMSDGLSSDSETRTATPA